MGFAPVAELLAPWQSSTGIAALRDCLKVSWTPRWSTLSWHWLLGQ